MDVKAIRTEVLLGLSGEEFNLVFRAVGKACGAKNALRAAEITELRKLNEKLAEIRVAHTRQAAQVAEAALASACALSELPLPVDDHDSE